MVRYGIYGGAFDPIHLGHLLLAESCLRQAKLDRVFFVPTGVSPHRSGKEQYRASTEDRLNMIESAIIGYEEFLVSRYEMERQETSYTVETLQYFHRSFALVEPQFFLLMGADMFNDLPNWYEAGEICKLALPLVATRPESPAPYFAALNGIAHADRLDEIRHSVVQMPQIGISSTQIRNRVAAGESIRFQVPRSVEAYIAAHQLYRPASASPPSGGG
jgi:nicotinate-nucleotide adenylyltransferase